MPQPRPRFRARPVARPLALTALALAAAPLGVGPADAAGLADFNAWTLVQDPADPDLTLAVAPDGTAATITLAGPVAASTDIGLASVDGVDVAASTHGFAFDPTTDFTLAIDYAVTFGLNASGTLGLGFGVGEDIDGTDSAGVAVAGLPGLLASTTVGRVDDANRTAGSLKPATAAGSLFITFNSITAGLAVRGDVTSGNALAPNAAGPTFFSTLDAIATEWDGEDLLASFFVNGGTAGFDGDASVTFDNLRVLAGDAFAVPEPATAALLAVGLGLLVGRRRHGA
jgi:hypothetical protein